MLTINEVPDPSTIGDSTVVNTPTSDTSSAQPLFSSAMFDEYKPGTTWSVPLTPNNISEIGM